MPALLAGPLPPLDAATGLRVWQFAPWVSTFLVFLATGYLAAVWRIGRRHPARPWPAWRTLAFLAGLGVIGVALQSSIGAYDDVLFSVHMVQHLLLIMVAPPPLLVVARPVTLLLHALGNPAHTWIKRAVRSRLITALTWPPGVTVLYCAVVVGTHLTPLMNLAVQNEAVHDAEHVVYLVVGYLFFLPVVGSEPTRWRVPAAGRYLMLLVTMPVDTAAGVILMLVPHELFPPYAHTGRTWGPAPLADLHRGGALMWAGGDIVMTLLALVVACQLIHDPRRAGHLGGWIEGIRRSALLSGLTRAGVAAAAQTADDDAQLAVYNTYLAALDRTPPIRKAGAERYQARRRG